LGLVAVAMISQQTATFLLLGVATGSLVALVALGVVLTFRASGVLNFSAGAVGAVGAFVAYGIRDRGGYWMVAIAAGLVVGAALGALTHIVLVLLRRSSTLAKAIATLGIMTAFQGFIGLVWGTTSLGQPKSFLPTSLVQLSSGISIPQERIIHIALVLALALGLRLVYSRTLFGLATSAVAEDRNIASLSGWAAWKIEVLNFVLAGVLSALAAILLAPIVTLDGAVLSLMVLPALAAALVGRFSSFLAVVGTALLIGVFQSEAQLFQPDLARILKVQVASLTGLYEVVPLLVILVAALTRGHARVARGDLSAKLPLPGSGNVNVVVLATGVGLAILMLFGLPSVWADALVITFAVGIVLLSIVVTTGYAGQLSLCQLALGGFGAWVAARLASGLHFPFELALIAGVLATIPLGILIAIPALRTRGVTLAVVTLAFALMIDAVVFVNASLTGGFFGIIVKSPSVLGINVDPIRTPARYGLVALILLTLLGLLVANLRRGRAGRRLLAVRSNERAAASIGIGVFGAKIYSMALGAGIAAVGGILLAFRNPNVDFTQFDAFSSIALVLYAIIGGIGWSSGSAAGAVLASGGLGAAVANHFLGGVPNITSWLLLFSGVNVALVLVRAPNGLAALNSEMFGPLLRKVSFRLVPRAGQPEPRRDWSSAALEVRDVTVRFGGVVALDKVSLTVRPGEVVGLIGPNGAGKTAMLDVITGFTQPSGGAVFLDGQEVTAESPERRARAGMARSWQSVELFEEMSVRENLLVAADRGRRSHYLTDLVRPGRQIASDVMSEVVEDFALEGALDERPSMLSQGASRLVGIARAIITEPRILFLDEPAAGLDGEESAELAGQIRRVADKSGLGVLVVEHDMELVLAVCDRIIVLDFGRKLAEGAPSDIVNDPAVVEAYLGVAAGEPGPLTAEATS